MSIELLPPASFPGSLPCDGSAAGAGDGLYASAPLGTSRACVASFAWYVSEGMYVCRPRLNVSIELLPPAFFPGSLPCDGSAGGAGDGLYASSVCVRCPVLGHHPSSEWRRVPSSE